MFTGNWQGLVCEEQRQLLGTEEESSDRHSSEDDTEVSNEVWTITAEQREYYTNQFRSLQPDTNALLAGSIARMFFEKSRLPVAELRKIWQLADVTKDGALTLQEFNTAMHLVVLRRNHIPLPNVLPPQLIPDRVETKPPSVSPPTEPASPPQTKDAAKEWTKFVDSPTSSISSPGPKPVNFDFQKAAVEKDPKILHPVPLRLTPDIANNVAQTEEALTVETLDINSPKKPLDNNLLVNHNDIRPIQRPQPKKIGLPTRGAIPPPPQPSASVEEGPISLPAPKKEPPPPPPPRPFRSHGRSSSLDLNRLGKGFLGAPPTVPPRVSPNIPSPSKKLINQKSEGDMGTSEAAFANFDQFQPEPEKYENVTDDIFPGDVYEAERKKLFAQFTQSDSLDTTDLPRKHGAFEVYRKPVTRTKDSPIPTEDAAKWELFKKLKEQNTVLLRLCQELSQELADVREERTSLRLRLEQQQQSAG